MKVETRDRPTGPAAAMPAGRAAPSHEPVASVALLDAAVARMAAASADMLELIAQIDREEGWREDGATSMSGWLRARYLVAKATATEWVRVAHAVEELPAIRDAYRRAALSWDQVRLLTRFVTPETDAEWAVKARAYPVWDLSVVAKRHERQRLRQVQDAHRRRSFQMWWEENELFFCGVLPGEQGAAFETAVSRRAEELPPDPDAVAPGEARLADAVTSLVTGAGNGERMERPTLVVHADVEVLSGKEPAEGPSVAETEGGQRLAPETIRRLACDAHVEVVTEAGGRPVGVGRRRRTVPPQIDRILRHRDRGCRFPGCGNRRWLNAHHVVHWADGGKTDLDNLVMLCSAHHHLLHEGRWRIRGSPGPGLRFYDARGRPLGLPAPELPLQAQAGAST